MHWRVIPSSPYDFALSIKRLQDLPQQITQRVEFGPVYVQAVQYHGGTGLVRIRQEANALILAIEGQLDPSLLMAQVRRAFALDLDLAAFLRHMKRVDPVMASIATKFAGLRPIAPFSLWESLAGAVIAQQVNLAYAFAMKRSLVRLGGLEYLGYPIFPDPKRVAVMRYEELQGERYSRRKAEYVIDLARAVVEGRLNLEQVVALPYAEAVGELVQYRGVGKWTAQCLLMDAGSPDAFPADDLGIRKAVMRFYGLKERPTTAAVRRIGESWTPYCALACYYLWVALMDPG